MSGSALTKKALIVRVLLTAGLVGLIPFSSVGPTSVAQQANQPQVVVRLFNAEDGQLLSGPTDVTWFKGGQTLSGRVDGDTITVPNGGVSPIETLRIHRPPFQPVSVKQLEGNRSDVLNLVLWPKDGPTTLDRVFEMLLTYERIYYDYGLDYSTQGRNLWSQIQARYVEAIRGMPHPASLPTDNPMKQEWAVHKYNDIVHVFMPPRIAAFRGTGHNHCPCGRDRCCWCGKRK